MIGLGSNRLTVCRRGGMSVTQAGRGGMEWLAGGRLPSWASPYSAQATAALLAQFPTQWPTIRDYGFAHPEIVGYMNAYAPEDAKIAYSLVPTLNVIRSIKSLGSAWFDTGLQNESNDVEYYCEWKEYRNSASWSLFGSTGASSTPGRWSAVWYHPSATEMYSATGNTDGLLRNSYTVNGWNTLSAKYKNGAATATLNGNALSGTYSGSVQNNRNIALFADKNASSAQEIAPSGIELRIWQKKESNATHTIVPFIRNGAAELLILETGNLCTKHGSFTISESPS